MHQKLFSNGYDYISEYNIKYITYIASLYELKENIQDIFDFFNEVYEKCFPNYPIFPKFTVHRLMTKLWVNDVFLQDQVQENLILCFNKIL